MAETKRSHHESGRACVQCGRVLPEFVPGYVAERLRELHAQIVPRPRKDDETTAQHDERSATWNETVSIHARVQVALLADEADGFCNACAPSARKIDA